MVLLCATGWLLLSNTHRQRPEAYDAGEWFKFRIHYGFVDAGEATLEVRDGIVGNKKVFHAVGRGWTTGMTKFFFKVDDTYESYFDINNNKPYQAVRKIYEGGYERDQISFFDPANNKVTLRNNKDKTDRVFNTPDNVQDVISTFYYLRNHPNIDKLKVGESVTVDMFFDDSLFKFKLKFIGREDVDSKYGDVPCMIFRPLVMSGRVFKEEESLTVWVSDDDNKLPIRIKASLAVGSIKADLEGFKGLKNPFTIKE